MNGLGDPIPLGDEVSEGRCSETRVLPTFEPDDFQCNTLHGIHGIGSSPCPSPNPNRHPSGNMPANPNRVTGKQIFTVREYKITYKSNNNRYSYEINFLTWIIGRRGGRSSTGSSRPPTSQTFTVSQEYSQHSVQREVIRGSRNTPNMNKIANKYEQDRLPITSDTPPSAGYKTQLGNQSLI